MALLVDVLVLLALVFVFLLLPAVLMVALFVLSRTYRGMFERIGFTQKEIGLLIFGSLSATLFSIDIPFLVYGNYLLAFNVAGALIPTVLSVHLLRAKRIHPVSWSLGILAVAVVSFFLTRVQPRAGIVAEFPWMLIPPSMAAALALILYSRKSPKAPAYAYATATLGSLIGADFFHLPQLFLAPGFVGSFGGAGIRDLVYIAGVLSLALVLVFATANLKNYKASRREHEIRRDRVQDQLAASTQALVNGHWDACVQRTLTAVQTRLRHLARERGTGPDEAADELLSDPRARSSYALLVESAREGDADEEVARWAMFQGQFLLERLHTVQRQRYASIGRRTGAFAIDAAIMGGLLVLLAVVLVGAARDFLSPLVLFATLFFWAWSLQLIYFTGFEYFWSGQSPGKRLLGLRVVDLDAHSPDFITTFTRNVVRVLDFAMLFYAAALLVIMASRRRQRVGDMVAQTVVLGPEATQATRPQVGPQPTTAAEGSISPTAV